jgi:hypothetical protein
MARRIDPNQHNPDRELEEQDLQQLRNAGADQESIEEYLGWRRHRQRQRGPLVTVNPSETSPAKSSSPATET